MTGRASSTPHGARPIGAFSSLLTGSTPGRESRARFARGDSPRSGQPVWRNSYYVGQIEERIWRPINGGTKRGGKRWTAAMLKAARSFERRTRAERQQVEPGTRNGKLGEIGIAVLEYLYQTVDYSTGRLEPAIRTIAEAIGHSYAAVHAALKRLREHRFLSWTRRSEPIEDPQPGGPLVRQASNAYALLCPPAMKNWLSRLLGKAPTPECERDRRARENAAFELMLAEMTQVERHDVTWTGDAFLGETLRSLAAAVDAREKQERESSGNDETGGL
ncbi:LexA family transcriptional regulator [Stakelama tenebrarum]|uniref:Helix-turn-helix domain-containing protein n=1 Tax=Stakelama tenebrarum TaxID=2711215 RepID=A0A6G6Y5K8_9SPHN|nr:helix-turn-helix domain-containing protein [Sphingosinithalassobacter tenebrarum]QIG80131.1 helix-turn-helix domain-containing protein [Sphingosinithalassobacter tenebrarum]